MEEPRKKSIVGCIIGTAVGDALGVPYEGVNKPRLLRLVGEPDRHRLFFGRGMTSDDTEHTCLVAQSLISCGSRVDLFEQALARRLRIWLLSLPAGLGLATLKASLRLWMGFSSERSGVYSAGNGPAMRAAILGAAIDDPARLLEFVKSSTRITHTDPKAFFGSAAVALAAQMTANMEGVSPQLYVDQLQVLLGDQSLELIRLLERARDSVLANESTESFATSLGLANGVSGYIYHSVPVGLHAWFSFPRDYRSAVSTVIRCGGDTDSTAAMVGGIVGASTGRGGIPNEWIEGIFEWPCSVAWMELLGEQVAESLESPVKVIPMELPFLGLLTRNVLFFLIVLFHGIRRLLPPY